ncbi:OLC1v1028031C1 [Oldenlandia corymbosa var. corymbosa]|uniref:OLC1v1028031C1 n=1 Tax=Oldenlandia corymbosa var. corymbosa TaxID=529605 RepID=A0AAV1CDQ2_OLDCO|nr:OLC1v1028031C1 [Oldenlandia corymbosa var. corymbosa]
MGISLYSSSLKVSLSVRRCQWKPCQEKWILPYYRRKFSVFPLCLKQGDSSIPPSFPKSLQPQPIYDPPEELYGLSVDPQPRKLVSEVSKPRSWFGPNGQYIRELPCPSCRARGYTPCTNCGIERPRADCSLCNGKGTVACRQCLGDCVIWEESYDEQPWEKARSISPLKVKEDDEVDDLDIKLDEGRKTKRVYHSPRPEVNMKISRALKSLNAKTGLFSKRMKMIHSDPLLRAQRIAAIKKTKGTPAARRQASEAMKKYFDDPENRRKRSISMKGVKFFCKNCGREGHRRNYCPELRHDLVSRQFRCRLCGGRGHNRRTCSSKGKEQAKGVSRNHHCRKCGQRGHNSRTCPQGKIAEVNLMSASKDSAAIKKRTYSCSLCLVKGHNIRTCPLKKG